MTRSRLAAGLAVALLAAGLGSGCRGPRAANLPGACTHVQAVREVRGTALCEDAWACVRPPGGRFDRIGLHRLAACAAPPGPVVLYLPGMHMNGALPFTEPDDDLRLYLAVAGIRTWGLDYRTHTVPDGATPDDLRALAAWDTDLFVGDAAWAADFIRKGDPGPFYLAGFSHGAALAYRLAARGEPIAGLVILDGAHAGGRPPASNGVAIDVGGGRLPFADREQLLQAVRIDPESPSPVAGYPTAGAALADILYSAPGFGGRGGLADTRRGVSDIQVLATLLAGYDRWWPRAALGAAPPRPPARPLRVLAFASTNMGPAWIERVRSSARAFGGDGAVVRELRGYGHLDVLVGRSAGREVYAPVRSWLAGN